MKSAPEGMSRRLRFEPLAPAHAPSLRDALLDPAVYAFIEREPPRSEQELAAEFARRRAGPPAARSREHWWNVAVFARDSDAGLGRLEATRIDDRAEVAYLFGPQYWGHGYAFEAMGWFQQRLAEEKSVLTFWATVLPKNERSVRLLRRLGYAEVTGGWPELASYDEGDLVFRRDARAQDDDPQTIALIPPVSVT